MAMLSFRRVTLVREFLVGMAPYLRLVQILIAFALMGVVILQARSFLLFALLNVLATPTAM